MGLADVQIETPLFRDMFICTKYLKIPHSEFIKLPEIEKIKLRKFHQVINKKEDYRRLQEKMQVEKLREESKL